MHARYLIEQIRYSEECGFWWHSNRQHIRYLELRKYIFTEFNLRKSVFSFFVHEYIKYPFCGARKRRPLKAIENYMSNCLSLSEQHCNFPNLLESWWANQVKALLLCVLCLRNLYCHVIRICDIYSFLICFLFKLIITKVAEIISYNI